MASLEQTLYYLVRMDRSAETIAADFFKRMDDEILPFIDEFYETACSAFTKKTAKLEPMPKTPSVKNRMQARKRKKVNKAIEDDSSTPTTAKRSLSKNGHDEEESKEDQDTRNGRPVRKCRMSKNVSTIVKKSKRAKADDSAVEKIEPASIAKHSPFVDVSNSNIPAPTNVASAEKKTGAKKSNAQKTELSANVSPSVRAIAKAYDDMVEQRNHGCIKTSVTKGLAGSPVVKSPLQQKTPQLKGSKNRDTLNSPTVIKTHQAATPTSREKGPPKQKPVRTRLRLNKKQAAAMTTEDTTSSNSESDEANAVMEKSENAKSVASSEAETDESPDEVINSSFEATKPAQPLPKTDAFDETCVEISEVYEICKDTNLTKQTLKLQKCDVVITKTTPTAVTSRGKKRTGSVDHGFISSDDKNSGYSSDSADDVSAKKPTVAEAADDENSGQSTCTRTRAKVKTADKSSKTLNNIEVHNTNKDSGLGTNEEDVNSTFTMQGTESSPKELVVKGTRTRARKQKEDVGVSNAASSETDEPPIKNARTRQRVAQKPQEDSEKSSSKTTSVEDDEPVVRSTRTRQRVAQEAQAVAKTLEPEGGAKRLVEHQRGMSPAPKRARSNIGVDMEIGPLSASSPIENDIDDEARDQVLSASKAPKPFSFIHAHRNTAGFLNRTPGFNQSTKHIQSFITPNHVCNTSAQRLMFKKNTPSPLHTSQMMLEQKRKKVLEKEKVADEKVKRHKEMQKRKLEEKQRERAERMQRVALQKQLQEEKQRQLREEQAKKRLVTAADLIAKKQEELKKEEAEKRKQRQLKQQEAELRRMQEEEEKLRKREEQEAEQRKMEELQQKRKQQEEYLRMQRLAEENKKKEERLAEKEQKLQEERAKFIQQQKEKEKIRLEREQQLNQERKERERLEREKLLEKERKLKEEMEKLKAMEHERLHMKDQELQKQREAEAQERELKQLINHHNKTVNCGAPQQQQPRVVQPTQASVLNTTQTLNTVTSNSNSYELSPVKKPHNNYDIEDRNSDDSTDDDEAPKKVVPEWAKGSALSSALIKQFMHPPDLDYLFGAIKMPDLEKIFNGKRKRRYKERTSSAVWHTPMMKFC